MEMETEDPGKSVYICGKENCGRRFRSFPSMRRHQRRKHIEEGPPKLGHLLCPLAECGRRFLKMDTLCAHVRGDHNTPESVIEHMSFNNFEEFLQWKSQLEQDTSSFFAKQDAGKTRKSKKYFYYYCHRSGERQKKPLVKEKRRRAVKSQGSCKVDTTCTAHICATLDEITNEVFVKFCVLHIGHDMTPDHLHLSSSVRLEIATLLHQGFTVSEVMDTMKDKLSTSNNPRDRMLRRKDINNIKLQFNVDCTRKHADDSTTIAMWVEEVNNAGFDSPVILYKAAGADPTEEMHGLSASDFVLCVQTVMQRKRMLEFGNGAAVCLDISSDYCLSLVTVIVIDDFFKGSPVAFMICNKTDMPALCTFFRAIKACIPRDVVYTASHVITDEANQCFEAWVSVFGPSVKKMCNWYVDRAWRRSIKEWIPDPAQQVEIYHMLSSLLQDLSEEELMCCMTTFVQHIQRGAPKFATYFSTYCSCATYWAHCYQIGTQAHISTYLESFHSALWSAYTEQKDNQRVDILLNILLRITREKAFERPTKVERNAHSRKVMEINKRHAVILSELPALTAGGWILPSSLQDDTQCLVVPAEESCICRLRCSKCDCCPHLYQCSCSDFTENATVCKHIHTIHELRRNAAKTDGTSLVAAPDSLIVETDQTVVEEYVTVESVEWDYVHNILSNTDDMDAVRQRLVSKCQQVMEVANVCTDKDVLLCALTHVNAADASLQTVAVAEPKDVALLRKVGAKIDSQ